VTAENHHSVKPRPPSRAGWALATALVAVSVWLMFHLGVAGWEAFAFQVVAFGLGWSEGRRHVRR